MNKIARDIFRAIHTCKWLEIEYKNKNEEITCYWIGIKAIDAHRGRLTVDGFNVVTRQLAELNLYISSIISSNIVEDSCYETDENLIRDIAADEYKYAPLFENTANLKILDYYADCCRLDNAPRRVTYTLIEELDIENLGEGAYHLSEDQFAAIVRKFHLKAKYNRGAKERTVVALCMNVCSLRLSSDELYVLAYKNVYLDVINRTLTKSADTTVCEEFTVEGNVLSIRKFLDEEYDYMLEDFDRYGEEIKELITAGNREYEGVDDMPYLMAIARDISFNPEREYGAIINSYRREEACEPVKAFFGDAKASKIRRNYRLALYDERINVDQLRVIHKAMTSALLYVQGPPGTGKTSTILNLAVTSFINRKTMLITSYNNHPMDELFDKLNDLEYSGMKIPFPVIRLGNNRRVKNAMAHIRELYALAAEAPEIEAAEEQEGGVGADKMKRLTDMLKAHEKRQKAEEKRDVIEMMISSTDNLPMMAGLQGKQLREILRQIKSSEEITEDKVAGLVKGDREQLLKEIFNKSVAMIRRLNKPKYDKLRKIVFGSYKNEEEQAEAFNEYLSDGNNLRGFLKIFPIVVTTNISAHRLGSPKANFDMVVMDEASQCSTAMALLPISRGRQLMLVGDPQQLKPVILLDPTNNAYLRDKYRVTHEYDYISKSVYKTFLAIDPVNEEILLSYHYRCHPQIIEFNNRKYYNSKLHIKSDSTFEEPLLFIDCPGGRKGRKNTCEEEALRIMEYLKENPGRDIGVITPFVNQRNLIRKMLNANGFPEVSCGTVHAYQGDEKQEIIFSLAITCRTGPGTYAWLKNNRELINVATSRAREKLVILGDMKEISRLHTEGSDDLYELCTYVRSGGRTEVSRITPDSRALGIRPYDDETEDIFLENLNHAVNAMAISDRKYRAKSDVEAVEIFRNLIDSAMMRDFELSDRIISTFYNQKFDYVAYEIGETEVPVFAVEIVNEENAFEGEDKRLRKEDLCRKIGLQLLRVPNTYARRYSYIKEILTETLFR